VYDILYYYMRIRRERSDLSMYNRIIIYNIILLFIRRVEPIGRYKTYGWFLPAHSPWTVINSILYGNRHFEIHRDNNARRTISRSGVMLQISYVFETTAGVIQNEQIIIIIIIIILIMHASHIVIYYMMMAIELSPIRRNDAKTCFPSTRAGPSRKVGDDTAKTIAVWCT